MGISKRVQVASLNHTRDVRKRMICNNAGHRSVCQERLGNGSAVLERALYIIIDAGDITLVKVFSFHDSLFSGLPLGIHPDNLQEDLWQKTSGKMVVLALI
ncbi:hypothetical protein B0H16DRAFT_1686096 [Mycena metata]|uniref:Uncharacterized protein n=1 Tax=Mycena metata TaxID=1033252 RepID=A0AAD7NQC3_9AGAR|nr:hypothetical protein B0H16DRAFT_1686096 [Mycena metata]